MKLVTLHAQLRSAARNSCQLPAVFISTSDWTSSIGSKPTQRSDSAGTRLLAATAEVEPLERAGGQHLVDDRAVRGRADCLAYRPAAFDGDLDLARRERLPMVALPVAVALDSLRVEVTDRRAVVGEAPGDPVVTAGHHPGRAEEDEAGLGVAGAREVAG